MAILFTLFSEKCKLSNDKIFYHYFHNFLFILIGIFYLTEARRSQHKHFTAPNSLYFNTPSLEASCVCTNLDALIIQEFEL